MFSRHLQPLSSSVQLTSVAGSLNFSQHRKEKFSTEASYLAEVTLRFVLDDTYTVNVQVLQPTFLLCLPSSKAQIQNSKFWSHLSAVTSQNSQ